MEDREPQPRGSPYPGGRSTVARRLAAGVALSLAAITLNGCGISRPGTTVSPSIVGVIDSARPADGKWAIAVGGQQLAIDQSTDGDRQLRSTGGLKAGSLLLFGAEPERWFQILGPAGQCHYGALANAAFDEADTVIFVFDGWKDVGIRLPKASDFRPAPSDPKMVRRVLVIVSVAALLLQVPSRVAAEGPARWPPTNRFRPAP